MATISATKASHTATLTSTTADILDFTNLGVGDITVFNHDVTNTLWVTTGSSAQIAVVAKAAGAIPVLPKTSQVIAGVGGAATYVSVVGSGGDYTIVVGRLKYSR